MDSVVGKLVEKRGWITWFTWDTNKALRQEVCTTYVGHRSLSILPKERRHWSLPSPILEAQAKFAGLVSTHVPDGNSVRRGKNDTGESVFPETDPISLFSGLFIYFLLHIGMNTESRRVSRPDPCQNQVLHIKLYKGLRSFTSSSDHEACWHFMALSDNSQSTRKLIFSRGDFFLNQAPPSK